ncbi:MAG: polyribonucleotide nucleotidyltransferase [Vicinamibacterales bacterium]
MHNVNIHRREIQVGSRTLSIETGKLAKQAHGAVVVRSGDTMVLVAASHSANPREGIDFLPMTVDYRENAFASGRIPGGFFKREGKPPEKEVLTSRLIDRPIRPLFPEGWRFETQIIAQVISADTETDADVLAITGASAALAISDMPQEKTIAGVRVGLIGGNYVINPTFAERKESTLDLIVAGSLDGIVMVEAGAKEVTEPQVVGALEAAHAAIKLIIAAIDALKADCGKTKLVVKAHHAEATFEAAAEKAMLAPLVAAMRIKDKLESYSAVDAVLAGFLATLPADDAQKKADAKHVFHGLKEKALREEVLHNGHRLDGRAFDQVRPIWTETTVLPRVHGSVVFTRGETQALVTCTLGTADDEQKIEHVTGEFYKRFMLHYNFPPYSVGETGRFTGPGRREIGHGALAERSLTPVLPSAEKFAYTIRIVSDILESNGSSSMASVCGGSMAMMDAGVPIKAPVAGIAMGLIMDEASGKYAVLSDIAGAEDHYGDMDFKVAGTADGITALQMDIKVSGITSAVMAKALDQAKAGRLHILGEMGKTLGATRGAMSLFAPRIITIKIPVDKIRDVIGPGGKMIRSIIERTGVKIDVEDNGTVNVASADGESAAKAIGIIQELTATPELNKTYKGKVQRITDFGAFVEIMAGTDGLLHVSEIANHRVKDVRDELKEGQEILVKVINIDPTGKIRLSRKVLLADEAPADGAAPAKA